MPTQAHSVPYLGRSRKFFGLCPCLSGGNAQRLIAVVFVLFYLYIGSWVRIFKLERVDPNATDTSEARARIFPLERVVPNARDRSEKLPQWMKEYFEWHGHERARLHRHADSWNDTTSSFHFLVMTCLASDLKCGGTADRLRPLPFMVRLAAETSRLLFVYWERPAPLEAFLLPPIGGVDWRLPSFLVDAVRTERFRVAGTGRKLVDETKQKTPLRIVRSRVQMNDHGSGYYNEQERQLLLQQNHNTTQGNNDNKQRLPDAFAHHFADCWKSWFTPAPLLASVIVSEMNTLHLRPGEFASAHVRANYAMHIKGKEKGIGFIGGGGGGESEGGGGGGGGRDPVLVEAWTKNSLNCLSNLRPGGPFFLASDTSHAKQVAIDYGKEKNASIVTSLEQTQALHIDVVPDWQSRRPSDYMHIFVDLYIMSMGRCMTFNVGGFGTFALHLSGQNQSCARVHWTMGLPKKKGYANCSWTEPMTTTTTTRDTASPSWRNLSVNELFLLPMKE